MAELTIEIKTDDCAEDEAYSHEIVVKEGQSLVDAMLFAVEAAALMYSSRGIKYISIIPGDD